MSKKLFSKVFILLLVVGLLFAVSPTKQAQAAATRTVCAEGCDFTTIQAAIDGAAAGDTINVAAGSYNENVIVDKSVTLTGAGRDVTTVTAVDTIEPVFRVTADGVTISGFTLTGASGHQDEPFQDGDGINLDGADNCVVTDNAFIANRQGAYVTGSYNAFQRNIISNNFSNGVILIDDEDEPTHLGDNNTFDGNTIADNIKYGLSISSSNNTVINNTITGNDGCGVALFGGTSGNTINFNAISGNTGFGGVYSIASYTNDATKNWWGTETGPIHSTNPGATGNKVYNVDYSPWLGFVPGTTPMDWYLNETGTIQDGIDAAANGETIHVLAGTYVEDVVVNDKFFNLIGAVDTNGDPISILEGSLFINNPALAIDGSAFTTIKNIYFDRTDSHLLILQSFNGGLIENCLFDGNNTFANNGINLNNGGKGNSKITVKDSIFKDGLYVGIGGYANEVTVNGSTFTNVKSGINMQGNGNLVVTDSTFLTKPVSDGDSYGIRFASSSGSTPNLTVTGSTFTIDDSLGFDPTPTDYHATIIIRAGATGTIAISGNTINNELVGLATVADLDAIYAANVFPFGYGVYGTKITAAPTKVNMSPATITGNCDAEYVAYVNVTAAPDTTGYHMVVNFNPAMVEVTKVENGTFLTGEVTAGLDDIIDNTNGRLVFERIKFATGGINYPDNGNGSLIKITFTPKAAGVSSFTIDGTDSYLMDWPNAFPYPYEITGGASVDLDGVVKNLGTGAEYCDLASAVEGASSTTNQTLQLLADIIIPETVTVDKALTLDLNGKKATVAATTIDALNVTTAGNLNVTDTTTEALGKITGGNRAARVNAGGLLTLTKGTLEGTGFDGVFVYGEDSSVTVNGGTITGLYYGISGNGSAAPSEYYGTTTILITGGTVQGGETAIFHPQGGPLTINDGEITGGSYNGIEMKAGDLIITGGTITASGAYVADPVPTASGNTPTGDAIFIFNRAGYPGTMTVDISGGTITSENGYALREFTYGSEPSRTTLIEITGGDFSGGTGTGEANEAVTFMTVAPDILKVTDGRYNYDPGVFVYAPYGSYFADPWWQIMELTGTIAWDPGQTGQVAGEAPLGVTVTGDDISFEGLIEWYPAVGLRPEGNRVGVQITAPAGFPTAGTTFTFAGATYNWDDVNDGDNFVWIYPKVTAVPQSWDIVVTWKTGVTQTFTVNVTSTSTLNTPPAPVITSTDVVGPYIPGVPREFNISLSNAGGAYYALAIVDYQIVGVSMEDIEKFEYFPVAPDPDAGTWVVMGTRTTETYTDCMVSGVASVCGQFGWAPGGFGPFPADFSSNSLFRITFKNGQTANLPLTLTLKGKKTLGSTEPWVELATFTAAVDVYENVQITGTAPDYYLVGDAGESTITITNPDGGAPYGNHIEFNLTIFDAMLSDIDSAVCSYGPIVDFDILPFLSEVGGNLTGTLFPADGAFTVDAPYYREISCTMVFNTAKDYASTSEMKYVVGSDKYTVATNTATAVVYPKPVIVSALLPGSFQQGVAKAITIDVNNVGLMDTPNNFTLHLALPEGTVVVYGGDTFNCTETGCDIPVVLAAGDNPLALTVTFMASSTADVTISLVDPDIDPGRVLATITGPNVVHANVALVTGAVTMQGRLDYNYAKFTLTGTQVGYGPYPSTRSDAAGAFSFDNIIADTYTITTDMPRYLNITTDMAKKITLPGALNNDLPTLWLRAGNAVWFGHTVSNNTIDIHDANWVGTQWGGAGSTDLNIWHGDVNFDDTVDIRDLALVGGNFELTSAAAYTDWLP